MAEFTLQITGSTERICRASSTTTKDTSATHLGGLKKNKTRIRESLFVSLEKNPNDLNDCNF